MKELKWRNWPEWIETNEVKQMNWNEWIEINELKWMNWKESIAKSAPNPHFFHVFFFVKWTLSRQVLVHIVSTTFPGSRREAPRKQRPFSGDHRTTTDVQSRVPDRSGFPTPWWWLTWWCGWHDDWDDAVVAMMIEMMMWLPWWLRWWCGCHDGETAGHWQSSVTRKFPN